MLLELPEMMEIYKILSASNLSLLSYTSVVSRTMKTCFFKEVFIFIV